MREHVLPDRSLSLRYNFVHILYQQSLYADLLPTRRAQLSLAIARALSARHGDASPAVTAEMAYLFEAGRDFFQSARQFLVASQNAAHVFAHADAVTLARRGLALLGEEPASPKCDQLELKLETMLGLQLQTTKGYAAPEAQQAYERARRLCGESAEPATLFPVVWGLWLLHKVRSELTTAQRLAEELAELARRLNDPDLALQAHQALGMTAFCRGHGEASLSHVEQAVALYDPRRHGIHSFQFGQDPGVICKGFGAVVLWLQGFPDAAARQTAAAIKMSENLSPSSQAVALHFAAMVHQLRRDPLTTRQHADACANIAAEHGFSFWQAGSTLLRGSAVAAAGDPAEGSIIIRQGLADWQATGSVTYRTYFLGLLAEALLAQGHAQAALVAIDDALDLVQQTDERFYLAELYRLRGETILQASAPNRHPQAEQEFRRALDTARRQNARSLQLRAALSLARIGASNAHRELSEIVAAFNEGSETPDHKQAADLLQ
jgi:adenylate cyclase